MGPKDFDRSTEPPHSKEAFEQLVATLNEVEDEFSGIPSDASQWEFDGRLYPPQRDSERPVQGHPKLRRFRSRDHSTYIGTNGSVEIRDRRGQVILTKPGIDGRKVWDL